MYGRRPRPEARRSLKTQQRVRLGALEAPVASRFVAVPHRETALTEPVISEAAEVYYGGRCSTD